MSVALQSYLAGHGCGVPVAIYSVCSAHALVLRAATELAAEKGSLLLVEATSNQVNRMGGYTGMRPAEFRQYVETIAAQSVLPCERLILGGDYLGPIPWRHMPADEAMKLAEAVVTTYAAAGFIEINLDASMPCKGDPATLSDAQVAARSIRLCRAAEAAYPRVGKKLVYGIGTEELTPGRAKHALEALAGQWVRFRQIQRVSSGWIEETGMEIKIKKQVGRSRSLQRLGWFGIGTRASVLLALIPLLSSLAIAQTGFSGLRGNIKDSPGATISGAQVVVVEPATGETLRTALSDAQGNFEFPNLKPGTYQVKSAMTGFKLFVAEGLKLDADRIRRLDVKLAVGSVQETVDVHAGAA